MIGFIRIDLFRIQVGVFRKDKHRVKVLREEGCEDVTASPGKAFASAHLQMHPDGTPRFCMVIPKGCPLAIKAHECVHVADYIMDHVGIPTGEMNTEIRAYLVQHLFEGLEELGA